MKPVQRPKINRLGEKQKRKKSGNCPDPEEPVSLNHPCHSATLPLCHSATSLLRHRSLGRHACSGYTGLQSSWNIVIVWHHGLSNSIVTNRGSLFTSKFWSLLCYFFDIKRSLSIAFDPQTDAQTKRQNSTIEAYLQAFVNFKEND